MSELLDGMEGGDLLQHVPSSVRTSLETLERSGTDWNAVGSLLAATPTAGVVVTGTGQWTADLWEAVKWEFRSFLCTDSERYAELRGEWDELKRRSPALALRSLSAVIGTRLGVAGGIVAPMVTWLFIVARRMGKDDLCLTLTAAPGLVAAQTRSPFI